MLLNGKIGSLHVRAAIGITGWECHSQVAIESFHASVIGLDSDKPQSYSCKLYLERIRFILSENVFKSSIYSCHCSLISDYPVDLSASRMQLP